MTFALTAFSCWGNETDEPLTKHFSPQMAKFTITGAATDVSLDISNLTGTFWTAALANGTYGVTVATPALKAIKDIQLRAAQLLAVESEALAVKQPSGATAPITGQWGETVTVHLPTVTYFTAEAPTAYVVYLRWDLLPGYDPVKLDVP